MTKENTYDLSKVPTVVVSFLFIILF